MVADGAVVGSGAVTSVGVAGAGGTGVAVAVGVAVGSTMDGVTWTTPGVRVGTGVGTGVAFLVQPAAMMSARPRIATIQSRLMLAQCLMNFLLCVVKLRESIPHILAFAKKLFRFIWSSNCSIAPRRSPRSTGWAPRTGTSSRQAG